ncbi:MAG: hypothetical protein HUJ97_00235 [Bacteroidales bacterium]|nr:hypothetical protein [Bacteroidales bacterium]
MNNVIKFIGGTVIVIASYVIAAPSPQESAKASHNKEKSSLYYAQVKECNKMLSKNEQRLRGITCEQIVSSKGVK